MAEIKEEQQEKKTSYKSLLIENIKYKTLLTKKFQGKKPYSPKDIRKITAFIPGTITKVYVKQNKKVKIGDKLLVLDAMKMRNDITSPVDGVIKQVNVKEGMRVTKEDILIEIE